MTKNNVHRMKKIACIIEICFNLSKGLRNLVSNGTKGTHGYYNHISEFQNFQNDLDINTH